MMTNMTMLRFMLVVVGRWRSEDETALRAVGGGEMGCWPAALKSGTKSVAMLGRVYKTRLDECGGSIAVDLQLDGNLLSSIPFDGRYCIASPRCLPAVVREV